MNTAGTAVQSDMIAKDQNGLSVQERMSTLNILQIAALDSADDFILFDAGFLHHIGSQLLGNHIVFCLALAVNLKQIVIKVGTQADGNIGRQSPSGSSPDHNIGLARYCAPIENNLPLSSVTSNLT